MFPTLSCPQNLIWNPQLEFVGMQATKHNKNKLFPESRKTKERRAI